MRTPMIPLTLLPLLLAGCSGDPSTALLAAGGASAVRAAKATAVTLPFRGTIDAATHTSACDPETNGGLVHLVGTGHATQLGRYTLVSDIVFPTCFTPSGTETMTLTAANGDLLFAAGTAEGTPSEDGMSLESVETLTITGGTGRFAGATGSFTLRQVNLAPDRESSGRFEGTITLAR